MLRLYFSLLVVALLTAGQSVMAIVPWSLSINTNNIILLNNLAADGSDNAMTISNAIVAASKGGVTNGLRGGTVEIPAGTNAYLCGPLNMANNVNLKLDAGAVLRMLPYGTWPGYPYTNSAAVPDFITGPSVTNILISGSGAIDGQGAPWWPGYKTNNRPVIIQFTSCKFQSVQNVTLSNSPMFHMAFSNSKGNILVDSVTVLAPDSSTGNPVSHNTDACDVSGTNILVQNCNISTGDDNFTCGGGTSDVLITNNTYGNGHGCSIGSYTDGGVANITVINCTFNGTQNGVRIKTDAGRGGLVQNINYYNLSMTNVNFPIQLYGYYLWYGTPSSISPAIAASTNAATVTSTTPIFRNITYSNINATANSGYPIGIVWARTEMPATNIVFNKVNITGDESFDLYHVSGAQFIDCNLKTSAGTNTFALYDASVIVTNSAPTNTLFTFDGLTANGFGNSFAFYNATTALKNTNAFDNGPLTLAASKFTVSNNLTLFPSTVLNYTLGTNAATVAVVGNLSLGGTINVAAGPGFTNGTYTLLTNTGVLNGSLPTLGSTPTGYNYTFDTNTVGTVKLTALSNTLQRPAAPTNFVAIATNQLVTLNWSPVSSATSYNLKRSLVSGSGYAIIAGNLAGTNYSDTTVTNGTTYYYVVSGTNAVGDGTNSVEVSATPQAPPFIVVTTNIFTDVFANSSLNSLSLSAPTATNTSYELISSKSWSPTPSLAPGHLKFGIAGTGSGSIEVQARFASSPVTLATIGDSVSVMVTFTNTAGILTQTNGFGLGLYNSAQSSPVAGGLNAVATSSFATNVTGGAQMWAGYVGQLNFTNTGSQVMTRLPQTVGTLANNDQDVLTIGSGSSSYNFPAAGTVGSASAASSVMLSAGNPYTDVLTITLSAANTLAITNFLYAGTTTNGTLLAQFGAVASGSTFLTNSFDALAVGWRALASSATAIDINQIAVNATLTVSNGPTVTPAPPPAPANLTASATNLAVSLAWNAVNGATNYNLKRGTVSGSYLTVVSGLTATNYTDANVTNAVNYFYVVSAVGVGGESTNSLPVSMAPLPSNQPTNVVMQIVGNQLQLAWPQDHLGWRLQIQTNDLSAGLSTNWATVPNSTNVMGTTVVINPTNNSVFLRLVYP